MALGGASYEDTRGCQELRKALRPGANLEAKLPAEVISINPAVAWKPASCPEPAAPPVLCLLPSDDLNLKFF